LSNVVSRQEGMIFLRPEKCPFFYIHIDFCCNSRIDRRVTNRHWHWYLLPLMSDASSDADASATNSKSCYYFNSFFIFFKRLKRSQVTFLLKITNTVLKYIDVDDIVDHGGDNTLIVDF